MMYLFSRFLHSREKNEEGVFKGLRSLRYAASDGFPSAPALEVVPEEFPCDDHPADLCGAGAYIPELLV